MIVIEIESQAVAVRSGTSAKTGNPYTIREQSALLFREGEKYPERIKLNLDDGVTPYAPGRYSLHDSSFSVNRYDSLQVRPVLSPVKVTAAA